MNAKIVGTVLVILIIVAIGGYLLTVQNQQTQVTEDLSPNEQVSKTDIEVTENPPPGFKGKVLAGEIPYVTDFVKSDYDQVKNSDNLIVLYFYANWCPVCREEILKFYSAFDELSKDSNKYAKVVGFRVNYNDSDTDEDETALAKEFGVAYQHTKVFIKKGIRILKSPESWEKQRYLDEINRAI